MSTHAAYALPDALFVPRDEALDALVARCEAHPLVTLIGEPGVGKSTLVSRLRHARGPIARLDLDGVDPEQTPDLSAHLLGLLARDGAPLSGIAALDAKLVVFDNADRLIPALQAVINAWRQEAPSLHMVITARQPAQLPDEQLVRLEPMPYEAAHALCMLHAGRAGAAPQGDGAQHAIERLLRELDGNPLAIALAASRLRTLTPTQLLERLSARIDLLRRDHSGGRFDSLRAAFEDAWQDLGAAQRALYLAAATFQGGFTLEALEAVADTAEVPDVLDVLESLLDRSLIRRVASRREAARYALPNGLRRWASAVGEELPASREAMRVRHMVYFVSLALRAAQCLQADRLDEATALLDEELDNLIAAWQHARQGDHPEAQTLRALFDRLASARQRTTGVLTLLGACLDLSLTTPEDAARHALRLQQRAEQLIRAGQTAAALRELDQATRLLDGQSAGALSAALHQTMAAVHVRAGQLDAARYHYERALGSVEQADRPRILVRLGRVALNMGDHPRAQEALQEALGALRASGVEDPELSEARILSYLAALRLAQGRMEETRRLSHEALAASRIRPDPKLELTLREQLGLVAHELGDLIDAARHYQLATEAAARAGQPQPFTLALRLSHLALDHRQPQQALAHLEPVLRDPQAREVPLVYGLASLGCGLAQLALDRPAHADDLFEQATARFQQLRLYTLDGLTCACQAICAAHLPDAARSRELLALARARLGQPTLWMEQTLGLIAELCASIHDETQREQLALACDRAQELVEQACDRFDPSPHGITDARLRFFIELAQLRAAHHASPAALDAPADIPADADALVVAERAAWFRLPGQTSAVELRRKRVLRRLLDGLVAHRVSAPGATLTSEQLIALGWPDERFILNDSAHNRLYVALNRLRTEGLEALLQTERDGYRLDPRIPIKRVDD